MAKEIVLCSFGPEVPDAICCIEVSYIEATCLPNMITGSISYPQLLQLSYHYHCYGDFWGEHHFTVTSDQLREWGEAMIQAADKYDQIKAEADYELLDEEEDG